MTPTEPGQPVPVVPVSRNRQWRRFLAFLTTLSGAALQTITQNAPQIQAQYPACKWMGGFLFLAGLAWSTWQRFSDMGEITHVNLTQPPQDPPVAP